MAPISAGNLSLTSSDGNRPMAYHAASSTAGGQGVVVIPARLGLLPFYKTFVQRLAATGIHAIAVDLYGRTARDTRRNDDFDFAEHYDRLIELDARPEVDADVAAAIDFLRSPAGGEPTSIFTLGFCFGGSISWWHSALAHELSGCIGLYGGPRHVKEQIANMHAPLLLLNAGADQFITEAERVDFENQLAKANVAFESKTYQGAPHSFFDRHHDEHSDAANDAWDSILGFIDRHSVH